jgi:hypothetical protein
MSTAMIVVLSALIFVSLTALAIETAREFNRMNHHPDDFSGSDRLAGTGE